MSNLDQSDRFSSGISTGFLSFCADPGSYLSHGDCTHVKNSSVKKKKMTDVDTDTETLLFDALQVIM